MNIPEKLAEAINRQDWQLVSDVHESLTGQAIELPEDRKIGYEILNGLQDFIDAFKRGEMPPVKVIHNETVVEKPKKNKVKKIKSRKETAKNLTIMDEEAPDPPDKNIEFHEPTGGQAQFTGTVKVDPTKTQFICTEKHEGELERRIKEDKVLQETGPAKRSAYKEIKYVCCICNQKKKSIKRLSKEEKDVFICDDCGKKG